MYRFRPSSFISCVFLFFIFHFFIFHFFCVLLYDIHFHNNNTVYSITLTWSACHVVKCGVARTTQRPCWRTQYIISSIVDARAEQAASIVRVFNSKLLSIHWSPCSPMQATYNLHVHYNVSLYWHAPRQWSAPVTVYSGLVYKEHLIPNL